jgi:bacteriocin-like protein
MNYVTQKLSKKEMNSIIGGIHRWQCVSDPGPGPKHNTFLIYADTVEEAAEAVHNATGSGQVNCTEVD